MPSTTPAAFQILLALVDDERHGLGILEEIETRTGTALPIGTLYRSLKALVDDQMIVPVARPAASGDDPRRRYYALTSRGRAAVREEARNAQRLVVWARARKVLGP